VKLKRFYELVVAIIALPVLLIIGVVIGLGGGVVVWWEKVRLTWDMRNGTYVWEEDDAKPEN
jgi:lipopolysaccharide/colanic/teichoic acid biosynthesis glycosyltransferase